MQLALKAPAAQAGRLRDLRVCFHVLQRGCEVTPGHVSHGIVRRAVAQKREGLAQGVKSVAEYVNIGSDRRSAGGAMVVVAMT